MHLQTAVPFVVCPSISSLDLHLFRRRRCGWKRRHLSLPQDHHLDPRSKESADRNLSQKAKGRTPITFPCGTKKATAVKPHSPHNGRDRGREKRDDSSYTHKGMSAKEGGSPGHCRIVVIRRLYSSRKSRITTARSDSGRRISNSLDVSSSSGGPRRARSCGPWSACTGSVLSNVSTVPVT